jgi:CHASE2 domain-containing sensor protein
MAMRESYDSRAQVSGRRVGRAALTQDRVMFKTLSRFLPLLIAFSAYAQTEAPTEKASPLIVVIFLVLFVGSCVGYFAYMWWNQRKSRQRGEGKEQR